MLLSPALFVKKAHPGRASQTTLFSQQG